MKLVPLGVQDTAWVASVKWGLGPEVRPRDLVGLPIVSNQPRSAMFRQIKDWFATAGLEPLSHDLCNSVAVIGHLVSSGVALGVLPARMMEAEVRAGLVTVLRSVPDLIHGRVYASYPEGGLTAPVSAMVKSIQKALEAIDYLKVDGASWSGQARIQAAGCQASEPSGGSRNGTGPGHVAPRR